MQKENYWRVILETRLKFEIEQLKAKLHERDAEIAKQQTVITNLKRKVAELNAKHIKKQRKVKQ